MAQWDSAAVGGRLRRYRENQGRTVASVARQARIATSHLYGLENGNCSPSVETLVRLAGALGVSPNDLLEGG